MGAFLVRRFLQLIFVLFSVSVIVFLSVHLVPGDPARVIAGQEATAEDIEAIREALGLNQSLPAQYIDYMRNLFQGNLGFSYQTNQSVESAIALRMPNTIKLAVASLIVSLVLGLPLGIIAAIKRKTIWDTLCSSAALIGISIPNFWLGAMLIMGLAVAVPIFPVAGFSYPWWTREGLVELVLPAITLGTATAAMVARMTRSSMLEVLEADYIRTVRAKGMAEKRVVWVHSLRNALIPIITVVGLNFGGLLGGALVTEQVFAINGIGQLVVSALNNRDFPMIQGVVLLIAFIFVLVNFLVDILYAIVDPRINVTS